MFLFSRVWLCWSCHCNSFYQSYWVITFLNEEVFSRTKKLEDRIWIVKEKKAVECQTGVIKSNRKVLFWSKLLYLKANGLGFDFFLTWSQTLRVPILPFTFASKEGGCCQICLLAHFLTSIQQAEKHLVQLLDMQPTCLQIAVPGNCNYPHRNRWQGERKEERFKLSRVLKEAASF